MNLEQWCRLDEQVYVAESDERFKQYAGLGSSEETIERLANIKSASAGLFLKSFCEPRELYFQALENIADSRTKKLELQLFRLRNEKIVMNEFKFKNAPVNWSSWRQFNSQEKDTSKRKKVFNGFISKTRFIAPVIKERFDKIAEEYRTNSEGRVTPLKGYLENENIQLSKLKSFVQSIGGRARKPFTEMLNSVGRRVLGRQPEYYDDFYFFRNRVFKDFEGNFSKLQPIIQAKTVLTQMGIDISEVHFDTKDRKDKYPSPICFFVQVPTDIRVLFKTESPYFDLQGCFHETGHAMHASAINPRLEYWNRYGFSMGVAEIFSIFLERLTKNSRFLRSIGVTDQRVLDNLHERNSLMELFFISFYSANSLMKAEYWSSGLAIEAASELYAKLFKKFVGLEMPGEYWMLHHILPDAIMYVPSYLLAAVRAAELESRIQNKFGETWWKEKGAGKYLREVMSPGAKINLSEFSRLNTDTLMKDLET